MRKSAGDGRRSRRNRDAERERFAAHVVEIGPKEGLKTAIAEARANVGVSAATASRWVRRMAEEGSRHRALSRLSDRKRDILLTAIQLYIARGRRRRPPPTEPKAVTLPVDVWDLLRRSRAVAALVTERRVPLWLDRWGRCDDEFWSFLGAPLRVALAAEVELLPEIFTNTLLDPMRVHAERRGVTPGELTCLSDWIQGWAAPEQQMRVLNWLRRPDRLVDPGVGADYLRRNPLPLEVERAAGIVLPAVLGDLRVWVRSIELAREANADEDRGLRYYLFTNGHELISQIATRDRVVGQAAMENPVSSAFSVQLDTARQGRVGNAIRIRSWPRGSEVFVSLE